MREIAALPARGAAHTTRVPRRRQRQRIARMSWRFHITAEYRTFPSLTRPGLGGRGIAPRRRTVQGEWRSWCPVDVADAAGHRRDAARDRDAGACSVRIVRQRGGPPRRRRARRVQWQSEVGEDFGDRPPVRDGRHQAQPPGPAPAPGAARRRAARAQTPPARRGTDGDRRRARSAGGAGASAPTGAAKGDAGHLLQARSTGQRRPCYRTAPIGAYRAPPRRRQ